MTNTLSPSTAPLTWAAAALMSDTRIVSFAITRCDFWNNASPLTALYEKLYNKLVPTMGEAETPHGELLRIASKVYYDIYNNRALNMGTKDFTPIVAWVRKHAPALITQAEYVRAGLGKRDHFMSSTYWKNPHYEYVLERIIYMLVLWVAREDERSNALKMHAKGYEYIVLFPSTDIEPLYAKTLVQAADVVKEYATEDGYLGHGLPISQFITDPA